MFVSRICRGIMNKKQMVAARKLEQVLGRCGAVGLEGGVYDGRFCLWPVRFDPQASDDFFEEVARIGIILYPYEMNLDGGAGA